MNCTTIGEFLSSKYPGLLFGCNGDTYESIAFESHNYPSKDVFLNDYEIWVNEKPLRLLRQQRNQLLQQSDWMAVSDRTMTQAQTNYRQALRDLPSTADPQLDEQSNLTNVTWPSYE